GRIDLHLLRNVTPAALEQVLAGSAVHVLHCAAPAALTPRGNLRLLTGRGVDASDLAEILAQAPELRLVTLTGRQGDAQSFDGALPLLATMLLGDDLPATISFGGPLPALLAARFSAACYGRLAAGTPVDLAITAGRLALVGHSGGCGWGFPPLRLVPRPEPILLAGPAR